MTRETRLNLWFLGIFLVITLPGAVILFIKKLDPGASRMDTPDAVLMQLPYMAPVTAPPGTRWMVPPKTRQWLADLTQQKTGGPLASSVTEGPEWEPLISNDHLLQLMSHRRGGQKSEIDSLLLWTDRFTPTAQQMKFRIGVPGQSQTFEGNVTSVEEVSIPPDVRKELVQLGFDHPPSRVLWIEAAAPDSEAGPWERITLEWAGAQRLFKDSVDFRNDDVQPAPTTRHE